MSFTIHIPYFCSIFFLHFLSALHLLMGQMRYQLQMGLTIAVCIETHQEEEISKVYPKLRPKTLDKYKLCAKKLTSTYFLESFHDLFDLELKSRSGGAKPTLLLDLFIAKIQAKRS